LNFPDKNPNNHNILFLHEERLGCANNLFIEKKIEASQFYEKHLKDFIDICANALHNYLQLNKIDRYLQLVKYYQEVGNLEKVNEF
jgi:hypothetical protein